MVLNAAFEKQGKEGGQACVDDSQHKTKERVTRIGCAECTSRRELFLETVRETRTAMFNIALRQPSFCNPWIAQNLGRATASVDFN